MLKKATQCKQDWDLFLPYVLFAYRQTPHSITGPFQLIYGVHVGGPLEVLRDNWLDGDAPDSSLIEWIDQVRTNLCDFAVIASDKSTKMKRYYDKSVKGHISLDPGEMVLVRTPGLSAKFSDSWTGPFEVTKQVSLVTWEIATPLSCKKFRVVHGNMLRLWHTSAATANSE